MINFSKKTKEQEKIIKDFFKKFNEKLLIITDFTDSGSEIFIDNIPKNLPIDEKQNIAIEYYRIIFFRMLIIHILAEWNILEFNPISSIIDNEDDKSKWNEKFSQLFFNVFCIPKKKRSNDLWIYFRDLPYLNNGLFIKNSVELFKFEKQLELSSLGFFDIFSLFQTFNFKNYNKPNSEVIDIQILGYIFERTFNMKIWGNLRKVTGSYYTPSQLTNYICKQSLEATIIDRIKKWGFSQNIINKNMKIKNLEFLDIYGANREELFLQILFILKRLKICDPSVGSGSFLRSMAEHILSIYKMIYAKINRKWTFNEEMAIKKRIIQENLYGVDIIPNATEICIFQLWLWYILPPNCDSHESKKKDLEPFPNIQYNILIGNALIGYIYSPESLKNSKKNDLLSLGKVNNARDELNQSYYEEKIPINIKKKIHMKKFLELKPFHWEFEFFEIFKNHGGFDIIIGNPPWNAVKPLAKEFFIPYDKRLSRRGISNKNANPIYNEILKDPSIQSKWNEYREKIESETLIYKGFNEEFDDKKEYNIKKNQKKSLYNYQTGNINGRTYRGDLNLYKLFLERIIYLIRDDCYSGLIIPSAFYSDIGTKGLRALYFNENQVLQIIGFENNKGIFRSIHRSFKFIILIVKKGGKTEKFYGSFMNRGLEVLEKINELGYKNKFMQNNGLVELNWQLMKKLSPTSHSIIEFNSNIELSIVKKMYNHDLLMYNPKWLGRFKLFREFDMSLDSEEYFNESAIGLELYEGKKIEQYNPYFNTDTHFWVDEPKAIKKLYEEKLSEDYYDHKTYRVGYRAITGSKNRRSMIASLVPKNKFCGNSLIVTKIYEKNKRIIEEKILLYLLAVFNSFTFDYLLRMKINTNVNMYIIYQMPIPNPESDDKGFDKIITNTLRLTEDWSDFKDLRENFGIFGRKLSNSERLKIVAENDRIIAKLYGLTIDNMKYILDTFHHNNRDTENTLRTLEKLILENY